MDMIAKGKRALGGRIAKVKEAGPGLVLSAVLLEDGTNRILIEDGTSKLLMEA